MAAHTELYTSHDPWLGLSLGPHILMTLAADAYASDYFQDLPSLPSNIIPIGYRLRPLSPSPPPTSRSLLALVFSHYQPGVRPHAQPAICTSRCPSCRRQRPLPLSVSTFSAAGLFLFMPHRLDSGFFWTFVGEKPKKDRGVTRDSLGK